MAFEAIFSSKKMKNTLLQQQVLVHNNTDKNWAKCKFDFEFSFKEWIFDNVNFWEKKTDDKLEEEAFVKQAEDKLDRYINVFSIRDDIEMLKASNAVLLSKLEQSTEAFNEIFKLYLHSKTMWTSDQERRKMREIEELSLSH